MTAFTKVPYINKSIILICIPETWIPLNYKKFLI